MVTKSEILKVLKNCYDPEIPISIVDLGLVYNIKIKSGDVKIKLGLTSPCCPMATLMVEDVKEKVSSIKGVKNVEVELVTKPWSPNRAAKEARKKLGL